MVLHADTHYGIKMYIPVSPFIVIPRNQLHERRTKPNTGLGIKDTWSVKNKLNIISHSNNKHDQITINFSNSNIYWETNRWLLVLFEHFKSNLFKCFEEKLGWQQKDGNKRRDKRSPWVTKKVIRNNILICITKNALQWTLRGIPLFWSTQVI